jgi:hypothetical protein
VSGLCADGQTSPAIYRSGRAHKNKTLERKQNLRKSDGKTRRLGYFVTSDGAKASTVDTARELHGAESTYRDYYQEHR